MSHLDEGTLHALLDGELGSTELMEIEAHLGSCAACGSRLRDAREFLAEADRLVNSVQFGRFTGATVPPAASAQTMGGSRAAVPPPPPPPPQPPPASRREEPYHAPEDEAPVLLIPDNPDARPAGRAWLRGLAVAATLAVAVGMGYVATTIRKDVASEAAPALANPALANRQSDAVASPAELQRFDSGLKSMAEGDTIAPSTTPPAAAKEAPTPGKPAPKPAAKAAPPRVATVPPRQLAAKPEATDEAADKPAKSAGETKPESTGTAASDTTDAQEEAATAAAERDAVRLQASRALSQLDRERRISRAAAATARLDQAQAELRAREPATPAPPTLEQRSQVYLRIGLDEASRQLGGPVHVIEGMSPVFMGLAPGRVAAGADTTRPVVRVVYQDSQGRMIALDQQRRSGPGGSPASGSAWSIGDVTVGLRGEVPAETLRLLRNRVR
jgi:hypothetical protein